jgi:uncharacterized protein YndB with AHSA1/START domain
MNRMATAKKPNEAETEEFVISRTFDAPRALVWQAWTDPEALAQWWGPKGSTIRVVKHDMRPGGVFHYAMAFPGREMWGRFAYREIVPPERLVFINSFSDPEGGITRPPYPQLGDHWPLEILNRLTLTEHDGKTTLTLRGAPINASEEGRKAYASMHGSMRQGFAGTFEQLDAYLAKARTSDMGKTSTAKPNAPKQNDMEREVTLTRVFSAPVDVLWQAWTNAGEIAQWWGPEHFDNPVCNWDATPGGKILVHMRAPDGTVYPMTGTFREVERPRRLVFLAVAEDSDGERLLESLTTVSFEPQGDKTKVTVHAKAVGIAPIAAQMLAGMEQGWSQSLDKLARTVSMR